MDKNFVCDVYYYFHKTKKLHTYQAYIRFTGEKFYRKSFAEKSTVKIGGGAQFKAWQFIFELIKAYNIGESLEPIVNNNSDITLNQFVSQYEDAYLQRLTQNRKNLLQQKNRIKLICSFFGEIFLKNITVNKIEKYQSERQKSVGNNTINKEFAILSALMQIALKNGLIDFNPCRKIDKLKVQTQLVRKPISNIDEVFKAVWNEKILRDYCLLLFYTGLRCNDVISLTADNIREKAGVKFFDVIESKTGKNIWIPIHSTLLDNNVISETGYVFNYSLERNNAVGYLSVLFAKTLKQNNIKESITPYYFRHTFQDTLEAANVEEV